ncbi:MAG: ATP-binding cassette domain-containing protein [Pseudomonadota bacterium]
MADTAPAPLLRVAGLTVALPPTGDRAEAVTDVTLSVGRAEIVCLVGESGSGKSVVGQAILGMLPRALPVTAGQREFAGAPLPQQRDPAYLKLRSTEIATIFQDATASLDPVQRIGTQLSEILAVHGLPRSERRPRIYETLAAVALDDPAAIARAYPHQLSGGQAQRVVIAAALLRRRNC